MRVLIAVFAACLTAATATASFLHCPDIDVIAVAEAPDVRDLICRSAARKSAALGSCNIDVPTPLSITATTELPSGCAGLFDCNTKEILIAPPDYLAEITDPDRPLRYLSAEEEFASVIAHEMVHAAYEGVSCPVENCLATTEYLAYAMQVETLSDADRVRTTAGFNYDHDILQDEINPVFLLMAPDKFLQKAWLHFSQREDPCGYVDQIMGGEIHFDLELPF